MILAAACVVTLCVGTAVGQSTNGTPTSAGNSGDGYLATFASSYRSTAAPSAANEESPGTVSSDLPSGTLADTHLELPNPVLPNPVACGDSCTAPDSLHRAFCEECPTWGLQTFVGYDSWRGIADDSWQNNGIHVGANIGTRLGPISDATGIGFQLGASIGVYDWSGTDYRPNNTNSAEPQGFITYGFFRKANASSNWTGALVQDWMLNNNFGEYSQNPTMSQLRAQLGYTLGQSNELGLWGTCRVLDDSRFVTGVGSTTWRPIDQLNLYWHHKWQLGGADTTIWFGLPEQDRLGGSGSLGEYIAGASANVPLSDKVALYTLITYMHPSAGAGPAGSTEDEWNFTIGLAFYPGRNARSSTVAGQCWMPLLPVANNGYFFVDTNHH
jgi:hypothetical protein